MIFRTHEVFVEPLTAGGSATCFILIFKKVPQCGKALGMHSIFIRKLSRTKYVDYSVRLSLSSKLQTIFIFTAPYRLALVAVTGSATMRTEWSLLNATVLTKSTSLKATRYFVYREWQAQSLPLNCQCHDRLNIGSILFDSLLTFWNKRIFCCLGCALPLRE